MLEKYEYNEKGQRIKAQSHGGNTQYFYNRIGQLVRAGNTTFTYDDCGNLTQKIVSPGQKIRYSYSGTALQHVLLPDQRKVEFKYGPEKNNPRLPLYKYINQELVAKFEWLNLAQLKSVSDYRQGLHFEFCYAHGAAQPATVIVSILPIHLLAFKNLGFADTERPKSNLLSLFNIYDDKRLPPAYFAKGMFCGPDKTCVLDCYYDQVGSLCMLARNGAVVQEIFYDSFGNIYSKNGIDLTLPLGFAGGLYDPDTGLVHFGFRDYDPEVGRFTCPDPLGETFGDHDLYDYCVDDPVSMNDPSGLLPPLLALLAIGKLGGLVIGGLTGLAAAAGVDIFAGKPGEWKTTKGMRDVAPYVLGSNLLSTFLAPIPYAGLKAGGLAVRGYNAINNFALGSMAKYPGVVDKAVKTGLFADGYKASMSPLAPSRYGAVGSVANRFIEGPPINPWATTTVKEDIEAGINNLKTSRENREFLYKQNKAQELVKFNK